jgi:hypothetical protein
MWITPDATDAPVVQWGLSGASLDSSAPANATTYAIDQMCTSPANETRNWVAPGTIYAAIMSGLVPGDTVYYRIGCASAGVFSPVYSFFVGPRAGVDSGVSKFIVFGDTGGCKGCPREVVQRRCVNTAPPLLFSFPRHPHSGAGSGTS